MEKFKFADRRTWKRVIEKEYRMKEINKNTLKNFIEFEGYISVINIIKVSEASTKVMEDKREIKIADNNFKWVQLFPYNEGYCITASIDENNEIVQWYIDIVNYVKIGEDNVPFFLDCYLDLVLLPDGKSYVLDEDELLEAYKDKEISSYQYNLAKDTLQEKVIPFCKNVKKLEEITYECLDFLEK